MKTIYSVVILLFFTYLISCTTIQPLAINPYIYDCIDFNGLSSGDTYVHNDAISDNGVNLKVDNNGWVAPLHAKVDNRSYALGTGLDLNLNNISVDIEFERTPEIIFLQFGDLGGQHKLNINGNVQTLNDLHSLNGQTIGGVNIVVEADTNGHNWYGIIGFTGNVNQLLLGGQELWIDNVCGVRSSEHIALLDLRRHSNAGILPEFLIESVILELNNKDIAAYKHTAGELNASLLSQVDILVFFPKAGMMSDQEKDEVTDYINSGGGVLLLGDYVGPNTTTLDVYQNLFDMVDAIHENNVLGNATSPIVLSSQHFNTHPIIQNINSFEQYAATTVSGDGYNTVVHTHNYNPNNRPLIIAKEQGGGRIVVSGDATFIYDPAISNRDNSKVLVQIFEWLLKER